MARKANPLADPVKVQKNGPWLQIRYYPRGVIEDPKHRKWYPKKWDPNDPIQVAEAHAAADRLREEFGKVRAAHGVGDPERCDADSVTVEYAVGAYFDSLDTDDEVAEGTARGTRDRLGVVLRNKYWDAAVTSLQQSSTDIVDSVANANRLDGRGAIDARTKSSRLDALAKFGRFIAESYGIADPFEAAVKAARRASTPKRQAARERLERVDPFGDDQETTVAIRWSQVPSPASVLALSDAVLRRESEGLRNFKGTRIGSTLPLEVATLNLPGMVGGS